MRTAALCRSVGESCRTLKTGQRIISLVSVLRPVALLETITLDLSFKMADLPTVGNCDHGMRSLTLKDVDRSGYAYFGLGVKLHLKSSRRSSRMPSDLREMHHCGCRTDSPFVVCCSFLGQQLGLQPSNINNTQTSSSHITS